jgi:hypothetical protein
MVSHESLPDVAQEIAEAERVLEPRARRLRERIRNTPVLWE